MSGMDHPPSTTSPEPSTRRAVTTAIAVTAAVAAPVALVAFTAGGGSLAAASQPFEPTSSTFLADLDQVQAQAYGDATLADLEALSVVIAPPTTTTTAPPPPPPPPPPAPKPQAVAPVASGGGYNDPNNPAAWDRLAGCESGGNWATNTGNGYYGGLQFSLSSWRGVGGAGYPHEASRATQIAMGQRLWNQGGWGHWPGCSRKLGYR